MIDGLVFLPLVVFIVITLIKKKRQFGKVWPGTAKVHIAGKELCCRHCGHTYFRKREGILVTSWVALFHFEYWNRSASCYTCEKCGSVEWFVHLKKDKVEIEQDKNIDQSTNNSTKL